ncbi:KTSC domain-containing protein [Gordoniibacillus kamchatkensis]|nr:KTSC domain-containing protein [Paenibacillus sp. VKM B-2647]
MNMIPLESKQITHVTYDEETARIVAHYYNGEVREFPSVSKEEYDSLLAASNKYDHFMHIVSGPAGESAE